MKKPIITKDVQLLNIMTGYFNALMMRGFYAGKIAQGYNSIKQRTAGQAKADAYYDQAYTLLCIAHDAGVMLEATPRVLEMCAALLNMWQNSIPPALESIA